MQAEINKKQSLRNIVDHSANKRTLTFKSNVFLYCDNCLVIKGVKKHPNPREDMDISIEDNTFENIKLSCLHLENLYPGRSTIHKNMASKCSSVAMKLLGCRAFKEDLILSSNNLSSIYNSAICIDNSIATLKDNVLNACQGGVLLYLYATSAISHREELFDSHRDIILRTEIVKDVKDSFIGGLSSNSIRGSNASLLGTNSVAELGNSSSLSRVILKGNRLKEIATFGILVQHNSSCSIKISECHFKNVKEPVVINEKDAAMSRNYTRNFYQHDNSEMLAPTYYATPRQVVQSSGKGTVVIKNNVFEGSDQFVIRRYVSSYIYDLNNQKQPRLKLKI